MKPSYNEVFVAEGFNLNDPQAVTEVIRAVYPRDVIETISFKLCGVDINPLTSPIFTIDGDTLRAEAP